MVSAGLISGDVPAASFGSVRFDAVLRPASFSDAKLANGSFSAPARIGTTTGCVPPGRDRLSESADGNAAFDMNGPNYTLRATKTVSRRLVYGQVARKIRRGRDFCLTGHTNYRIRRITAESGFSSTNS